MARKTKMRLTALADKPAQGSRSAPPSRGPGRGSSKPPGFDPLASEDDRLETAGFVVGSVIVLVILIAVATVFGGRKIEADLQAGITGFLLENDIRNVDVIASGLDVSLDGTVDREELLAAIPSAIQSNFAVRDLDVALRYLPPRQPSDIEVVADPLVITWVQDSVTVTGTMSNQSTVDAILTTLQGSFGNTEATGLTVLEGVPPELDWLTGVLQLITAVSGEVSEGQITVNAKARVVQFAAEFETRQARSDVRAAAEEVLASTTLDFTSSLTVENVPTTTVPPDTLVVVQNLFDDTITGEVVEFEFNSAILRSEGTTLLDDLLVTMLEFPDVPIQIAGHTDDVGDDDANLELSRRRAESVVAYLVQGGADPARFVVIGYGETQPIGDNATEEGRAQNRRIVFTALEE